MYILSLTVPSVLRSESSYWLKPQSYEGLPEASQQAKVMVAGAEEEVSFHLSLLWGLRIVISSRIASSQNDQSSIQVVYHLLVLSSLVCSPLLVDKIGRLLFPWFPY